MSEKEVASVPVASQEDKAEADAPEDHAEGDQEEAQVSTAQPREESVVDSHFWDTPNWADEDIVTLLDESAAPQSPALSLDGVLNLNPVMPHKKSNADQVYMNWEKAAVDALVKDADKRMQHTAAKAAPQKAAPHKATPQKAAPKKPAAKKAFAAFQSAQPALPLNAALQ